MYSTDVELWQQEILLITGYNKTIMSMSDACTMYLYVIRPMKLFSKIKRYFSISNIRRNNFQNLNVSRLVLNLSLSNPLKPREVENEDVVGAAPTGDAPTTSE